MPDFSDDDLRRMRMRRVLDQVHAAEDDVDRLSAEQAPELSEAERERVVMFYTDTPLPMWFPLEETQPGVFKNPPQPCEWHDDAAAEPRLTLSDYLLMYLQ